MIYLNYSLIFAATALFFFLVILASTRYLQEKLEFSRAARYEKLRRFVSPQKLLMEQVFAALITACLLFLGQLTFGVEQMRIAIPVAAGFGVLAFLMPYWYYVHLLKKRQKAFESKILDLAMGLANGMRSGLALGQAVEALSKRIGGPMKEELVVLLREHRLGLDLPEAFRETSLALKVGKLFYSEQTVFPYNELGIGRLIYQLPVSLCENFLKEIFGPDVPEAFDEETLGTVNRFFQNNLNIAETSRQLHMHRNTLIYRLEQIQKRTGLDIRLFEDAMTFKIAIMVLNYLQSERNH